MKTARIRSDFGLIFQNRTEPHTYILIYMSIFISIIDYIKLLLFFFLVLLIVQ